MSDEQPNGAETEPAVEQADEENTEQVEEAEASLKSLGGFVDQGKSLVEDLEALKTEAASTAEAIEAIREQADGLIEKATETQNQATKALETAKASSTEVETIKTAITASRATVDQELGGVQAHSETISTLVAEVQEHKKTTSALAKKSAQVDAKLKDYESSLEALIDKNKQLNKKIEDLLPGATSANLASAFQDRGGTYFKPKVVWAIGFVVSIALLVALSFMDLPWIEGKESVTSSTDLLFFFFRRLPAALPIVWFALFTGRRYKIATWLEEEYAHKETLSRAFEGYKREMMEIDPTGEGATVKDTVATRFADLVQEALSRNPARIHRETFGDDTPAHSLSGILPWKRKRKQNDPKQG